MAYRRRSPAQYTAEAVTVLFPDEPQLAADSPLGSAGKARTCRAALNRLSSHKLPTPANTAESELADEAGRGKENSRDRNTQCKQVTHD